VNLTLELIAVGLLVLLNGFFVAAEYALVTARRTRIVELHHQGNRSARAVLKITSDPSQFITSHRHLQSSGASCRVAMNTFTYDARIPWDKLKNYSHAHTGGGTSESAYALKKALASQGSRRE